eukprot:128210-Alexandrium_andersonii.AAC.1
MIPPRTAHKVAVCSARQECAVRFWVLLGALGQWPRAPKSASHCIRLPTTAESRIVQCSAVLSLLESAL